MTAEIFNFDDYREKHTVVFATVDEHTGEAVLEIEGNWESARELIRHLWLICKARANDQ